MRATRASAPGKMILSGEYAVVFGQPGIAIPSPLGVTVTDGLPGELHPYVERIVTECERISGRKFPRTCSIESTLPLGRGMGSSTALIVSVCRALLGDDCREQAKTIEDIMSPNNSGLDFTVVWSGQPTLFRKGEPPKAIDLDLDFLTQSALIDTGAPGETTPELLAWIKERVATGGQEAASLHDAFTMIGQCTEALRAGEHPLTVFPDHHRAQLALGVVPEATHELIMAIEESGGAAKVLGAGARTGGGGMVLALHSDVGAMRELLKKNSQFSILNSQFTAS